MDPLLSALSRFGLSSFRPGQREVIEAVLGGRHTVAIMPTGAGKSLCYQLPATLLSGVTIVVSPLIALMKDQVDALVRRGIPAVEITSALDETERLRRLGEVSRGEAKLIYVAPERFRSQRFWEALHGLDIALFAVDEAHCVSQWGHDFRPDYLKLRECIAELRPPRLVALTATATPEVCQDIQHLLGMRNARVFVRGFDRPNLTFRVEKVPLSERAARVAELLRERGSGVGIVYVGTRKNAELLGEELSGYDLSVGVYHAGLSEEVRANIQDGFMEGKFDALVATNAFGMGVDKADVRVVIHADIPRSLEAYYQEAGRAGRDGKPASCILLFNHGGVRIQEYLIEGSSPPPEVLRKVWKCIKEEPFLCQDATLLAERSGAASDMQAQSALRILKGAGLLEERMPGLLEAVRPREGQPPFDPNAPSIWGERERQKLRRITDYAYARGCRRRAILEYFGDEAARSLLEGCGSCDNCLEENRRPLTPEERMAALYILRVLQRTRGRFGKHRIAQVLLGSSDVTPSYLMELSEYGALRAFSREKIFMLLEDLESAGLIERARGEYPTIGLTSQGEQTLRRPEALENFSVAQGFLEVSSPKRRTGARPKRRVSRAEGEDTAPSAPLDPAVEKRLKALREGIARREKLAPFMVWSNKTQRALALIRPKTRDALLGIPGIGPRRVERYGKEILAAVLGLEEGSVLPLFE